mmetsp:Transcript_24398/g.76514  ORF Transcript_24398/g.76514 Transcript_24398/m.76514 type:complete len:221 (+) Transcript_24398:152-814(+)
MYAQRMMSSAKTTMVSAGNLRPSGPRQPRTWPKSGTRRSPGHSLILPLLEPSPPPLRLGPTAKFAKSSSRSAFWSTLLARGRTTTTATTAGAFISAFPLAFGLPRAPASTSLSRLPPLHQKPTVLTIASSGMGPGAKRRWASTMSVSTRNATSGSPETTAGPADAPALQRCRMSRRTSPCPNALATSTWAARLRSSGAVGAVAAAWTSAATASRTGSALG